MGTDYTHARSAPVLAIYVIYKDKVLIARRSEQHFTYQGLWSCIAGFVDDEKSLEEKVRFEIVEELGLDDGDIKFLKQGETYLFLDEELDREWIRHLYLVEVTNPNIKLNWEHTEYAWIDPKDLKDYKTTPGFGRDFKSVLAMR